MLNAPIHSMGRELLAMSLAGDAPFGILASGKWGPKQTSPDGLIPWMQSHRSPLDPRKDNGSSRCWSRLPVLGRILWFNTEALAPPFLQDAYVEREVTQNV